MKLTLDDIHGFFKPYDLTKFPIRLLGIRGFDISAGDPARNDFGIYDDALAVVWPDGFKAFQATTDPGKRYIHEPINKDGCAVLRPGLWWYNVGDHRGHPAFVQERPVDVNRLDRHGCYQIDGNGLPKVFTGMFGINIHSGGTTGEVGSWSAGCQAIQCEDRAWGEKWNEFFHLTVNKMADARQHRVPYLLIENPEGPITP